MSLLEILCCFPLADSQNDKGVNRRQPVRSKLVISEPTLIHGGEATRSLNLVDVKIAARERVGTGGSGVSGGSIATTGSLPLPKIQPMRMPEIGLGAGTGGGGEI